MEFKVIDKTSVHIPKSNRGSTTITVHKTFLYFSYTAAEKFNMIPTEENKYIKLLEGLNENNTTKINSVFFIVTNKEVGFQCLIDKRKDRPGIRVFNAALIKEFTKLSKCKVGDKFYLQETDMEFQQRKVVEILVNKSINDINKNK